MLNKICTDDIITHVIHQDTEIERLKNIIIDNENNSIDLSLFKGNYLTTDAVAMLHGVSTQRVRRYITSGLIPTHPKSNERQYYITVADALRINFSELMRQRKSLNK